MLGFLSVGALRAATLGENQPMGGKEDEDGADICSRFVFYLQVKVARKGNMFLFFV